VNVSSFLPGLAALFVLVPIVGHAQSWTANGATACEKYLTPEFVSAVLGDPPEPAKRTGPNSCTTRSGSLYITLNTKDVNEFRRELPRIAGVHVMSGVGDAAYWNASGAVTAVKSPNRECVVGVLLQTSAKIHDAALGKKLGEICNKLFALP
jgi:hypothetical protein